MSLVRRNSSVAWLPRLLTCVAILMSWTITPAWAIDPELAQGAIEVDWQRCGPEVHRPTPFQLDVLDRFALFEQAYTTWQQDGTPQADRWLQLAAETFAEADFSLNTVHGDDGAFILRGVLLRAECLAFAAADSMANPQQRAHAIALYHQSLELLEAVMLAAEREPEHDQLPDFARQLVAVAASPLGTVHPWAGWEAIGTGYPPPTLHGHTHRPLVHTDAYGAIGPTIHQQVSSVRGSAGQRSLAELQAFFNDRWNVQEERARLAMQRDDSPPLTDIVRHYAATYAQEIPTAIGSAEAARLLLSELCPWGVQIYFMMRDTGLVTDDLDYAILRPFERSSPTFSSAGWPKVSELVLPADLAPVPIAEDAAAIFGDGRVGSLAPAGPDRIQWRYIDEPTTTVWLVSPRVFDPSLSERLTLALDVLAAFAGGLPAVIASRTVAWILQVINQQHGQASTVAWGCWLAVEGKNAGAIAWNTSADGAFKSSPSTLGQLAKWGAAAIESYERVQGFEGIDLSVLSPGVTYDGTPIPPVLVRTDIVGLVAPADDYATWVYTNRFYTFRPDGFTYRNPEILRNQAERQIGTLGQLSENLFGSSAPLIPPGLDLAAHHVATLAHGWAYHDRNEAVQRASWSRLPGHLGARSLFADSAPRNQQIFLPLTEDAQQVLRQHDDLRIQLLYEHEPTTLIDAPLASGDPPARIRLALQANEDHTIDTLVIERSLNDALESYVDSMASGHQSPMSSRLPHDIRSNYRLRVVRGPQLLHERTIVLDGGVGGTRTVTDPVRTVRPGAITVTLDPPLDLLRLEARWDGLQGGHRPDDWTGP